KATFATSCCSAFVTCILQSEQNRSFKVSYPKSFGGLLTFTCGIERNFGWPFHTIEAFSLMFHAPPALLSDERSILSYVSRPSRLAFGPANPPLSRFTLLPGRFRTRETSNPAFPTTFKCNVDQLSSLSPSSLTFLQGFCLIWITGNHFAGHFRKQTGFNNTCQLL